MTVEVGRSVLLAYENVTNGVLRRKNFFHLHKSGFCAYVDRFQTARWNNDRALPIIRNRSGAKGQKTPINLFALRTYNAIQ